MAYGGDRRSTKATIAFDANVHSNNDVRIARFSVAKELRRHGARVLFLDIPQEAQVNGIDDLIGLWGKERVLELILTSVYDPQQKTREQQGPNIDIDQIPNVFSFDSKGIEFVVDGLIARGSVTMLAGESGHGKSTLTAAMAYAITNGHDFCGRKCSQLPVLILDRENGIDAVQERFTRLGICKENCKIIVWGGWCQSEPPDPSAGVVLAWVKKTEPKPLVVVDSVAAFMEGDENNASDVRKFMDKLRQLAHLGAAVITLHNSGKAETSLEYRGSSDFKGSIDIGINVRNFGEGELGKIRLKAFKTRFAIDREVILNYASGQFVSDDRPHSATRAVTEQLTGLLRKNPGIKTADFHKLAVSEQLGRDRARGFLDAGVRAGEIRVIAGLSGARLHYLVKSLEDEK